MRLRNTRTGAPPWRLLVTAIVASLVVPPLLAAVCGSGQASVIPSAWDLPKVAEDIVTIPRLVRRVAPRFPRKAARAGVTEGMVVVQAKIDVDGRTQDLQVVRSDPSDLGFEEAAVRAVKKWRFEPGVFDGRAVAVYQHIRVDFRRRRPEP